MRKLVLLWVLILGLNPCVWADTIELQSGKTIEGKIIEESNRYIKIDIGVGIPLTYYMNEVKSIRRPARSTPKKSPEVAKSDPKVMQQYVARLIEQLKTASKLADEGQYDEAIAVYQKYLHPAYRSSHWHMSYGRTLSLKANAVIKSNGKEAGLSWLKAAEEEFQRALKMALSQESPNVKADIYYYLGQMYRDSYQDRNKAKEFFLKSLEINPKQSGAKEELANLDSKS